MSANRRHLYIPDELWSRLTSEAGTVGVRERGKAYSASEYACKLLAAGMQEEEISTEWTRERMKRDVLASHEFNERQVCVRCGRTREGSLSMLYACRK